MPIFRDRGIHNQYVFIPKSKKLTAPQNLKIDPLPLASNYTTLHTNPNEKIQSRNPFLQILQNILSIHHRSQHNKQEGKN